MERVIQLKVSSDHASNESIRAIRVTMSDDKVYYLVGNMDDLATEDNSQKRLTISRDVFGNRIAFNPSFIKTIRECECVIVTYYADEKDKSHSVSSYYVIGVDDTYKIIEPNANYTGKGSFAKQIYVPANSFE